MMKILIIIAFACIILYLRERKKVKNLLSEAKTYPTNKEPGKPESGWDDDHFIFRQGRSVRQIFDETVQKFLDKTFPEDICVWKLNTCYHKNILAQNAWSIHLVKNRVHNFEYIIRRDDLFPNELPKPQDAPFCIKQFIKVHVDDFIKEEGTVEIGELLSDDDICRVEAELISMFPETSFCISKVGDKTVICFGPAGDNVPYDL